MLINDSPLLDCAYYTPDHSPTVFLGRAASANVVVLVEGSVGSDLSVSPIRMTFTSSNWDTTQTVTVSSGHDDDTVADRVVLTHRTTSTDNDYSGLTGASVTVNVEDNDDPEVMVSDTTVGVAEGGTTSYTIRLGTNPSSDVTITINDPTDNTEVTAAPGSLTFTSTNWDTPQAVTVSATADADSVNDDATITHTAEGAEFEGVSVPDVAVKVVEEISVEYGSSSYRVAESDNATTTEVSENEVEVTVTLSADPHRTVTVPLTATPQGSATSGDYTAPTSVTFNDGETTATVIFSATHDTANDNEEQVVLGFGSMLPVGVSEGTTNEATVTIIDDDVPAGVTVSFGSATYTVDESDNATTTGVAEDEVEVTVTLSVDPERTVVIPLVRMNQGGATDSDYIGVPTSVTFNAGQTEQTFTITATHDTADDDGEKVKLSFGTNLPTGISGGTTNEATVTIIDDDVPAGVTVSFGSATYTVDESDNATTTGVAENEVEVTVTLSVDPERTVGIPLVKMNEGGATDSDYIGVPTSVTFNAGQTEQTFTITATHDTVDDDGEKVKLSFGTNLPTGIGEGTTNEATVTIIDDDVPAVTVSFGSATYTVDESDNATTTGVAENEVEVTVTLSVDPERTVAIPLVRMNQGGATDSDYIGVPTSVTFNAGQTEQTFTITATHDTADDDGEKVKLSFGSNLPTGISEGTTNEATVTIVDDDDPAVTVDDNTGDLRLVDGTLTTEDGGLCEGRLEVFYNGAWGTICDDYWTEEDADVACRALGFVGGSVEDWNRFRTAYFGPGTGEIMLDDLFCSGRESGLLECPSNHAGPGIHNCLHSEDVGLRCIKNSDGPHIINMEISAAPGANGNYDVGETVTVTVVWSEPVNVTVPLPAPQFHHRSPPHIHLAYGRPYALTTVAVYSSGSGTARTAFTATVEDRLNAPYSRVDVYQESLSLEEGTITSVMTGKPAILGNGYYRGPEAGGQAEAATITGVPTFKDPGEDGVFGAGETVEVNFRFNQPVQVDTTRGTPSVEVLLSGTAAKQALYLSGSGTGQLVFGYTLTGTDGTHSSLLVAPNSLALNGGSIQDVANMLDAAVEHQGAGAFFVQQVVDETALEPHSATVAGATLTLTYNEDLDTGVTTPATSFAVTVNGSSRSIVSVSVSGAAVTLTLATAVESGDTVTVDYTAPTGDSASKLQDVGGNAAESFSGQAVTNNTASSGTPRTVPPAAPGSPNSLNVSREESGKLRASWDAPDSGPTPTGYTVQWKESPDDWDAADDVSEANAKGTSRVITGLTDGVEYAVRVIASRDYSESAPSGEVTATPRETTPPSPSSVSVNGATLTITFDEPLDTGEAPDKSAFAVTVAGNSRRVDAVAVSGSAVTLTLVTAVFSGEAVTADYTAPVDESAARLQDLVGNTAASFSGLDVTNNTAQLTASVSAVPSSHDGNGVLTFDLRFSEEPHADFSYITLRDHSFTVTGGEVVKVRRLAPPSNAGWEITVRPDGNGAVTVVLPVTADCTAEGAIYTEDRRPQSSRLEVTVSGPVTAIPNSAARGAPTISGTVQVGQTLTASTAGISDSDGLANATFSYQWLSSRDTEIAGATSATYTLVETDEGNAIKVKVSFTDDAGNEETLTSAATDLVAARPNSLATGAPTVSGTVQVGETLTASTSGIADSDGLTNVSYSYQWIRNDGSSDAHIQNATGTSYRLVDADEGKSIMVRVTFTDDAGNEESLTSNAVLSAPPLVIPDEDVTPESSGLGEVQDTLLTAAIHDAPASHDGTTDFTFELRFSEEPKEGFGYKTLRDHAFTVEGGAVAGVRRLDRDSDTPNIRWEITVSPASGGDVTITLPVTEDCEADGAICTDDDRMLSSPLEFTVTGPPLTVSFESVPASHTGSNFTFELRFSEEPKEGFSYKTLRDHAFTVEGGAVAGVRRLDRDSDTPNIRWEITVSPDSSGDVTIILPVTEDCETDGAICANGDKNLSNRLERTVSGPDR